MKLTERKIETLEVEPGRKDRLLFDDAQRGLAVQVTASGGRNYLCQYTLHGQKSRVPLGSCSAVSLAQAREAAQLSWATWRRVETRRQNARTPWQPSGQGVCETVSHLEC